MLRARGAGLGALVLLLGAGLAWWSLSSLDSSSTSAGPAPSAREQLGATRTELVTPAAPALAAAPIDQADALPEPPSSTPVVRRPVTATAAPPRSGPLDVVVVDARSGVGLPLMRVRARQAGDARTVQGDRNGRASFEQAFEAGDVELTLFDGLSALRLETTITHDPAASGDRAPAFEWPIDVGPTYGLRIEAGAIIQSAALRAMLCELAPDGSLWTWTSQPLSRARDGQRWVRYKQVEHEPSARKPVLRVWAPGTFWGGEVPVPSSIGVHEGLTVVLRPIAGALRGRVTDAEGHALSAEVLLLSGRPQGLGFDGEEGQGLDLDTDEEGRFEAEAVAPGTHGLLVWSHGRPVEHAEVEIVPGEVTQRSFVLGRARSAGPVGDVRGTLISRPGAGEPSALVELHSEDGAGVSRVTGTVWEFFGSDQDGEERAAYEFTGVPAGRYRVRVVPLDGRAYQPSEQVVEVPASGIDFATAESAAEVTVVHRVELTDAATGAPVLGASACYRLGSHWSTDIDEFEEAAMIFDGPRSIDAEMVIGAPGYVPVRVRAADHVQVGNTHEYRVRLRRGHGIALVVADVEAGTSLSDHEDFGEAFPARAIPGATVLVDGRAHPVSPDGLALVEAGEPIEDVRVEASGWVMLGFRGFEPDVHGLGFALMARE